MPWLPENASVLGSNIDFLFYIVLTVTGTAFLIVQAALVYVLLRYRYRAGAKAHYTHGSHRLEIMWTLIPALILLWLALYQGATWAAATQRGPPEEDALVVQVECFQFSWQARYAGADGRFGTADDLVPPLGEMHVPVGRPILVKLTSRDVIHSYYVPTLRVKQDCLPGAQTATWYVATRPGRYEFACAELCGLGHFAMRGVLTVEEAEAFESWLSEMGEKAPQAAAGRAPGRSG